MLHQLLLLPLDLGHGHLHALWSGCNCLKHQNQHHMATMGRPTPQNSAADGTLGLEQAAGGAPQPLHPAPE